MPTVSCTWRVPGDGGKRLPCLCAASMLLEVGEPAFGQVSLGWGEVTRQRRRSSFHGWALCSPSPDARGLRKPLLAR